MSLVLTNQQYMKPRGVKFQFNMSRNVEKTCRKLFDPKSMCSFKLLAFSKNIVFVALNPN